MRMMVNGQEVPMNNIRVGQYTVYSEDEQVVGEWIDGKPVYQRTFRFTYPGSGDAMLTNDVDEVVKFDGWMKSSAGVFYGVAEGDASGARTLLLNDGSLFYHGSGSGFSAYKDIHVTAQYTKLSDEATR